MQGQEKRRDVEKERYWRRVIREATRSGVSIRQFCQQRKLRKSQFYWWQRRLKERQEARAFPGRGPRAGKHLDDLFPDNWKVDQEATQGLPG